MTAPGLQGALMTLTRVLELGFAQCVLADTGIYLLKIRFSNLA